MVKSKEVETVEGNTAEFVEGSALSEVATSDFVATPGEGFEDQVLTMTSLPVLALAQTQTPEVAEGATEGLHAGSLMNNMTKLPVGDNVEVVVYKMWKGRTKFPPRDTGGSIECWSPDGINGSVNGSCSRCPFADFNLQDKCLEQDCFIIGLANNPREVYRLILAKSNKRTGSRTKTMLASECRKTNLPIYGFKLAISTKRVKNEKQNAYYYIYEINAVGPVDKDALPEIREVYLQMNEVREDSLVSFNKLLIAQAEEAEKGDDVRVPFDEFETPTNGGDTIL